MRYHKEKGKKMKFNNKKRGMPKRKFIDETVYADSIYTTYITSDRMADFRVKINVLKRRHGIPQRWALCIVFKADHTIKYYKCAKTDRATHNKHIVCTRFKEDEEYKFPLV